MPGLKSVDDRSFVTAMTAINRAIINPWFMLIFVGAFVMPAVAAVIAISSGHRGAGWLIASAVIYLAGVLGVTGSVNVPLNVALDRDSQRAEFERRWVWFNTLRTIAATLSFAAALVGVTLAR